MQVLEIGHYTFKEKGVNLSHFLLQHVKRTIHTFHDRLFSKREIAQREKRFGEKQFFEVCGFTFLPFRSDFHPRHTIADAATCNLQRNVLPRLQSPFFEWLVEFKIENSPIR